METERYDVLGAIIGYEDGTLDFEGQNELLQFMLDTGLFRSMQGHYFRMIKAAIAAGDVTYSGQDMGFSQ